MNSLDIPSEESNEDQMMLSAERRRSNFQAYLAMKIHSVSNETIKKSYEK